MAINAGLIAAAFGVEIGAKKTDEIFIITDENRPAPGQRQLICAKPDLGAVLRFVAL
jgi:hypothetical protein